MTEEPEFIAQTAEPPTPEEQMEWIREQYEIGRLEGMTWFRATYYEPDPRIILVEGWRKPPMDEGAPRFGLIKQSD